jgi:hypothetical protein
MRNRVVLWTSYPQLIVARVRRSTCFPNIERAVSRGRCEDKYRAAPTPQQARPHYVLRLAPRALVRQRLAVSRNAPDERLPFAALLARDCRLRDTL